MLADDGLTLRWIPGTDSSGEMGNVLLYVNGEPYRWFGPTEFEAKLGPFTPGDTRSFTLAQKDAAGNMSGQTAPLRAVPVLAGKSLAEATAALGAAGFTVGNVTEAAAAVPPGTVVEPATTRFAVAPSAIDLVVARSTPAPQTRLGLLGRRLEADRAEEDDDDRRPDQGLEAGTVTATLRDAKSRRSTLAPGQGRRTWSGSASRRRSARDVQADWVARSGRRRSAARSRSARGARSP